MREDKAGMAHKTVNLEPTRRPKHATTKTHPEPKGPTGMEGDQRDPGPHGPHRMDDRRSEAMSF